MDQKFISVNGIKISFLVKNNYREKPVIFFIHGNSNSSRLWIRQMQDDVFSRFRLIAFDLPGHGQSMSPSLTTEHFNVIAMGSLLAEAVNRLAGDDPYILAGLSLGTNVIAEMPAFDIRPKGICLVSSTIVGREIPPSSVTMPGAASKVFYDDNPGDLLINQFLEETTVKNSIEERKRIEDDYRNVHPLFRSSLLKSISRELFTDEIETLKKLRVPLLCVYGKEERITSPELLDKISLNFWKNQIFKIPEAGHFLVLDQPRLFNRLLKEYASDVFTGIYWK
jgi:pimeloyl-ACP methyl ester carboxylesterase